MLATSNKPFAFKILPVNLYFPKILAVFTAQIFNSTRPRGGEGVSLSKVLCVPENFHRRNIGSGKASLQTEFAELCSAGQARAPVPSRGGWFVEATTSSCWLRTPRWSGSW